MLVLDTNTLIYFFKGLGQITSNLYACSPSEIAIPTVVLYELHIGIQNSTHPDKRLTQLATLLSQVQVLPFDNQAAETSSKIRVLLESKGTPIGPYDIQIAGTALVQNATLVTHNTKEFHRVGGLKLVD